VLRFVHQKATNKKSNVRLPAVWFEQKAVKVLPGSLEFSLDGFFLWKQHPDGIPLPPAAPFRKVPDFSGYSVGKLV
jgi:hypothetical protein